MTQDSIDAWWAAFAAKADNLDALFTRKAKWDLPRWMHEHLGAVHPKLFWEFGRAVHESGHRLVITPESRHYLRPLVNEILRRAPDIDGWEFYPYRLAEDLEATKLTVVGRTGGDITDTRFQAEIGAFHRIDLLFVSPRYSPEDQQSLNDVFVATEMLLGEQRLDKWIGAIEVARYLPAEHVHAQPIEKLKAGVDFLVSEIQHGLPETPYHKLPEDTEWTMWKLEPDEADDYPAQSDMFVGKSMNEELWKNAHTSVPFDSVRYSRFGETFCYVKIDGSQGLDEEKFSDKGEIEDALDDALRQADVGCFIGGGTGLRYSYIDLALTDVDRGAAIVKQVLRNGNINKRSWLLFYDADYEARWIGIWDDTPPPPLPEFE